MESSLWGFNLVQCGIFRAFRSVITGISPATTGFRFNRILGEP